MITQCSLCTLADPSTPVVGLVGEEDGKGPKRRKEMETGSGGLFGASSVWHKIPGVAMG